MSDRSEWSYTIQEVAQAYDAGYNRGFQDAQSEMETRRWRDVVVRNTIIGLLFVIVVVLTWGIATLRR